MNIIKTLFCFKIGYNPVHIYLGVSPIELNGFISKYVFCTKLGFTSVHFRICICILEYFPPTSLHSKMPSHQVTIILGCSLLVSCWCGSPVLTDMADISACFCNTQYNHSNCNMGSYNCAIKL